MFSMDQDCEKGHFFPSAALNTMMSYLLRGPLRMCQLQPLSSTAIPYESKGWEMHMAVAILLTATQAEDTGLPCSASARCDQIWSFGALLKFWLLPFLVMQATLATTTNSNEAQGLERWQVACSLLML